MTDGSLPVATLRSLRLLGVEPIVYSRTTRFVGSGVDRIPDPAWSYQTWLAGDHDDVLDQWSFDAIDYGRRIILRLDHEQPADWSPWSGVDPALYINAWHYIRERLPSNIKLYWCGAGWYPSEMMDYYPGSACEYVGFDKYSRTVQWQSLSKQWADPIDALRAITNKPIIVGEFGRLRGLPKRGKWIRSLRNVTDVWGAVYFDVEVPSEGVDWTMTNWMRRHFILT